MNTLQAQGLQVQGLSAGYGGAPVLQGVHLQLAPGEVLALLGRNGSGRSTLARALMGLIPATGQIIWQGQPLHGLAPHQRARAGVGYVSESRDVFPRLSVRHNLLLGEQPGQRHRPQALADLLALFPALARRLHAPAGVLSGGEQQMLALARCWMGQPRLMLIDEPTEGLAPQVVAQLAQALRHFQAQGAAVLLIEQKRQLALTVASRCAVMGHGRVVFDGTPAQLLADEALQREWLAV
jgi:branched-chain amino acid transport system ATP-binding protein